MNPPTPPDARSGGATNAGPPPSGARVDELWENVARSVADERGLRAWLRSRPTLLRVALVCGVLAAVVLAHLLWARRGDGFLVPGARLLLAAGAVVVAIAVCMRVVLAPLTRPFPRAAALGSTALLLLPVLAALVPELRWGTADTEPAAASLAAAAGCFAYGGILVLGIGAALWCVDRGAPVSGVRLVPAVVGAGLTAHLVLQIHCANDNPTHLLLGHASVGVTWLLLLLGLRAARRLPRARSR